MDQFVALRVPAIKASAERHVTCPPNSSGMLAMPSILCPDRP
jgi:hypothetical protein